MIEYETGIYRDIPDDEYHGDDTSLSSTAARRLLEVTPAQWKWERDNPEPTSTDTFDLGKAVHTLVLGAGAGLVDLGVDEIRTNKAKADRAAAWKAGKIPLRSKHYRLAAQVAGQVRASARARELFAVGEPEVSVWHRDPETGATLRARADWVHWVDDHTAVIVDLKKTKALGPAEFRSSVASFGYHIQQPWYQDAFAAVGVQTAFLFLAVPEEAPHDPFFVELSERAVELGRVQARRAIRIYAECVESGKWPGHGDTIHEIDLPHWAYSQEEYRDR